MLDPAVATQQGFETSRLPHFVVSPLKYGGEIVSVTHRLPFTTRMVPGTHFYTRYQSQDTISPGEVT
jgi:hypothetical protein